MTAHVIFESEMATILKEAGYLLSPEPGCGDARSHFQEIHHIFEDCKMRYLKADGGAY